MTLTPILSTIYFLLFSLSFAQEVNFPQYLMLNKALFYPGQYSWNQDIPSSCNQASLNQIFSKLNYYPKDNPANRKLGVSFQFNVMGANVTNILAFMDNFFNLSVANDLPVAVTVDAFEFWDSRPDLWNFFDPTKPGYNPSNRFNVEWFSWNSSDAVEISWRNWGAQFRTSPHPNLASTSVISAYKNSMLPILHRVSQFYTSLPPSKKYLFAYLKPSWEVWIGTNFFYYPNGNSLRNQPPANDPKTGLLDSLQLGFNAACTSGIQCSGPMLRATLDKIVQNYLEMVTSWGHMTGIPHQKMITHAGCNWGRMDESRLKFNSAQCGFTTNSQPGYSLYDFAFDPAKTNNLQALLKTLNKTHWAASEYFYEGGNSGSQKQQWLEAFNNTFSLQNNRLIDVFNWEGLESNQGAIDAVLAILSTPPSCLVQPASNLTFQVTHFPSYDLIDLRWDLGKDTDYVILRISSSPFTLPSGVLASGDIVLDLNLMKGGRYVGQVVCPHCTLYWSLLSVGCGETQAMVAGGKNQQIPLQRFHEDL